MSTKIIDELIVRLGLDSKDLTSKGGAATKTLSGMEKAGKAASSSVDTLTRSLVALLGALGGAYALKAFVEDTIASSAALDRLSKNLGISVENISAWGNAVEEVGGSAKGLQGTLSMLSAAQTELRYTGQSALIPYFASLGIAMADVNGKVRPVNDLLLDIADRFQHLDRPTANNLGKMMGIDQDTLNLLLQGRQQVELMIKRQKEFNVVTKAQAEESVKLQRSIIGLKQSFTALGRDLLQQASPAIEKMLSILQGLATWVENNGEFLKDLAVILGTVAAGLAAISLATSPIALVVAGVLLLVGAIALLWQDYQNWQRGGQSLIDWSKWKPGIDAAIKGIKVLVDLLKDGADAIGILKQGLSGDKDGANKRNDELRKRMLGQLGLNENGNLGKDLIHNLFSSKDDQRQILASPSGSPSALANGIAQAEGFNAKGKTPNRPQRNHNPGDMEYGDFAKAHGATGTDGRFAIFPDDATGFAAMDARLSSGQYAGKTDAEKLKIWAPAFENDTASYAAAALGGIKGAGNSARIAGQKGGASSSSSTDNSVKVDIASLTIQTQATDSDGIANTIVKSVSSQFTASANSGLN